MGGKQLPFKLTEPDASFITNLVVGILPAKLAGGAMISDAKLSVGCGPYVLSNFGMTSIDLSRNANYSLGAVAKSDIQIKIVREETTRFAKLQSGELDLVQRNLNRDELEKIATKFPQLKVERRPSLSTTYLGFNFKDPILAKKEVRQAINLAVERQPIIDYILRGFATPATTMLTPGNPFLDKSLKNPKSDLAAAMKLLDDAGFKDPDGKGPKMRMTLSYKTTTDVTRVSIAKAIASQLKKIGIDVQVQSLEWGRFKADVEAGTVQIWSLSWIGFKDPDIYRYAFATDNFPPNGANRGRYSNPELDKVLQAARIATAEKKRRELYLQVEKMVAAEVPYVFLWHEENFAVLNKRLKNFTLYADGRLTSLSKASK